MRGADLHSLRLFREPLWIVAPAEHRLASREDVARTDLRGETVLTLEPGHRLHDQVRALCEEFGATLSLDYEGTSLDTLRQMVGMGMGVAFLPALYVLSEVRAEDQIVVRRMRQRPPTRTIGMVWRRHAARQEEFVALADLVRDLLRARVPELAVMS